MSGGVDSSVAAALLKRQGLDVSAIFMRLWCESYSARAEKKAKQVAESLNIPFFVFNIEKKFKKKIVDYFLKEYKEGITPNPCVNCNKEIKFGLLLDEALRLGADYLATGHYARLRREIPNSKSQITNCQYKLFRGIDITKDQSYFLWKLSQKQLKHILFPIGGYKKTKVRELAKKFNLPTFNIPESQEICFIKSTVSNFLGQYIKSESGDVLTTDNKKVGEHQGLSFYTIGQRKGIGLSGGPFYVVDKNLKENTLIISSFFKDKNLYKKKLIAKNINWVKGKMPKLPLKTKTQIRYGHKAFSATIVKKFKNGNIEIVFTQSQRAITPGQSVVFYKYKELLGGGIIC
jgi:tRNA-specific 2-thiouridylase